jgi:hypothetical protein
VRFLFPSSYVPDLGERALHWFSVLSHGACARWRILINDSHTACSWFHGVTGRVKSWILVTEFCCNQFLSTRSTLDFSSVSAVAGFLPDFFFWPCADSFSLLDSPIQCICCFGFSLPPLNRWPAPGLLLIRDFQLVSLSSPARFIFSRTIECPVRLKPIPFSLVRRSTSFACSRFVARLRALWVSSGYVYGRCFLELPAQVSLRFYCGAAQSSVLFSPVRSGLRLTGQASIFGLGAVVHRP